MYKMNLLPFTLNKVVQMNLVKKAGSQIELLKIPVNKSICLRKFSALNNNRISDVSLIIYLILSGINVSIG